MTKIKFLLNLRQVKDKLKVSVVKELLLLLFPKITNKIFVIGYIFPRKDHLFPVQTNYLKKNIFQDKQKFIVVVYKDISDPQKPSFCGSGISIMLEEGQKYLFVIRSIKRGIIKKITK